ncbi:MAG: glycosyltransferase family 2 protein [Nitrososphaerota archaeon]|jgi:glycosyltransferase involved in cell wall biosynthesis|nr:glycosyltransferase family 2 protein [Nitrososphaerota archaeon]
MVASTLECVLVVVAYNEAGRVSRCLESAKKAPPPAGATWREWFLLDGGSSDNTIDRAKEWNVTSSLSIPLNIRTVSVRRGLSADLAEFHSELVVAGRQDEIVVVVEADSTLLPDSIRSLLQPFLEIPGLAATFGTSRADGCRLGQWASRFQVDVSEQFAYLSGATGPRAMGRLFAYRVKELSNFSIIPNAGGFDNQLAAFVASRRLDSRVVQDAIVMMTPPTGYRDFYLQTSRVIAANRATKLVYGADGDDRSNHRRRLQAFFIETRKHPLRAFAYLLARLIAYIWSCYKPLRFRDTWAASSSTK